MSLPPQPPAPVPPQFDIVGQRPFSFYPPILEIEHNEWRFKQATWSEILVVNSKTHQELWVPRRFLGDVSRVDEPVMIVGLSKELEYKMGTVVPYVRKVLEMPRAVNAPLQPAAEPGRPALVEGIRLESGAESRIGKLIVGSLIFGIALTAIAVSYFRGVSSGQRITYRGMLQSSLGLTAADDYWAVVRKLGMPREDHWRSDSGEVQYRLLAYPDRRVFIVLMGREREKALYIGALDPNWKVADSVELPGGGNTYAMLSRLQRF